MIPSLEHFLKKHLFFTTIIITVILLFFTFSIVKNSDSITQSIIYLGYPLLILVFLFLIFNDVMGYVAYSIFSLRFFDRVEEEEAKKRFNEITQWKLSPIRPSLIITIIVFCVTVFLSYFLDMDFTLTIFLCTLIVFPVLFYINLKSYFTSYTDYIKYKIEFNQDKSLELNINRLLAKEIIVSVIINFVIVLPLANKKAFFFNSGTATPEFIVAMLILVFCVWGILFLFSSKSKRYVILGLYFICKTPQEKSLTGFLSYYANYSRITRFLIGLFIIMIWEIMVLIILDEFFRWTGHFAVVYAFSVLPIYTGYILEKKLSMQQSKIEAKEMFDRHEFHSQNLMKQFK
ncbi:hypothetical protein [Thorsellia kenyensis]|uniref:DUF975 family protein n=1 Tax=Thorsellia kenyensis TaxID=1549888 RepID=A0ABV6CB92_9GAMM